MIGIYEEFAAHTAAIPVVAGRKSRIESFAGELLSCIMGSVSTYLRSVRTYLRSVSTYLRSVSTYLRSHSSPLHSTPLCICRC